MQIYDQIGRAYTSQRGVEPSIERLIAAQLTTERRILNIGAGSGSYEPVGVEVVALEPSETMIRQRKSGAAPVVQGVAEALPFQDRSFDLAMGILTLHHWRDWRAGLREAMRVAGGKVLLLTWLEYPHGFWLADYFPEILAFDAKRFPTMSDYRQVMGPVRVVDVPIPFDCQDGMMCAYWRRPHQYLDPQVRACISTFALIDEDNLSSGLSRLEADLSNGRWDERYGFLRERDRFDYGYRLLIT